MKKFEKLHDSITQFLFEEEGNITRNKVLVMGSMMILMGIIFVQEAFAGHSSHRSHSSHSSHKSHSSGRGGHSSHSSHVSHTSHTSSSTHSSHSSTTHSNAAPHSNVATPHSNAAPHSNVAPPPPPHSNIVLPDISSIPVPETPTALPILSTPMSGTSGFSLPRSGIVDLSLPDVPITPDL